MSFDQQSLNLILGLFKYKVKWIEKTFGSSIIVLEVRKIANKKKCEKIFEILVLNTDFISFMNRILSSD